jgi:hypothetical protein
MAHPVQDRTRGRVANFSQQGRRYDRDAPGEVVSDDRFADEMAPVARTRDLARLGTMPAQCASRRQASPPRAVASEVRMSNVAFIPFLDVGVAERWLA